MLGHESGRYSIFWHFENANLHEIARSSDLDYSQAPNPQILFFKFDFIDIPCLGSRAGVISLYGSVRLIALERSFTWTPFYGRGKSSNRGPIGADWKLLPHRRAAWNLGKTGGAICRRGAANCTDFYIHRGGRRPTFTFIGEAGGRLLHVFPFEIQKCINSK